VSSDNSGLTRQTPQAIRHKAIVNGCRLNHQESSLLSIPVNRILVKVADFAIPGRKRPRVEWPETCVTICGTWTSGPADAMVVEPYAWRRILAGQAGATVAVTTGKVIRFDAAKGYGFIAVSGHEDVFVHANEITDRGLRVSPGTLVEFEIIDGDRGPKAYDVRIVDDHVRRSGAVQVVDDLAPHPNSTVAGPAATAGEEELFDVLTETEFTQHITELLLTASTQLTNEAVLEIRNNLLQFAQKNGWVE
jgi:cold shock protein